MAKFQKCHLNGQSWHTPGESTMSTSSIIEQTKKGYWTWVKKGISYEVIIENFAIFYEPVNHTCLQGVHDIFQQQNKKLSYLHKLSDYKHHPKGILH